MFFKDFVSVKRQKIKRGASQTYDTPSLFIIHCFSINTLHLDRQSAIRWCYFIIVGLRTNRAEQQNTSNTFFLLHFHFIVRLILLSVYDATAVADVPASVTVAYNKNHSWMRRNQKAPTSRRGFWSFWMFQQFVFFM